MAKKKAVKVTKDAPLRYSVSIVTQGDHKFYTLTVPSEVLARTCFVTNRDEDPISGFQRVLDKKRAQDIANYIDNEGGSIPTSVVLSAQEEAEFKLVDKGKTVEFKDIDHAFLVLDGQHRVYGFSLAKTNLRVPVVIYSNLTRKEESRLFIDINTKQRPVPNELLLDIRKLAEYQSDKEILMSDIFDIFNSDTKSPLLGMMSPSKKISNKLSRVTFNASIRPLLPIFSGKDADEIYDALKSYFEAFIDCLNEAGAEKVIANPTMFKAASMLFPEIAQRVKDRYGSDYSTENFLEIISPMFERMKTSNLKKPGSSFKTLHSNFLKSLKIDFTI